jgi:histidyl-tRNA synthetase
LTSVIGGDEVQAAGFALEMDVIASLLPDAAESNSRVTIRTNGATQNDVVAAFELAHALRAAGKKVDVAPGGAESPRDVVVDQGKFLLTKDGASTSVSDVADVVQAFAAGVHA